jgi:cell division protein FtsZ
MSEMGMAMMGTGVASGDNRARIAAEAAISSPLLEDVDMTGARGVLVNITAGLDMSIGEFEEVGEAIKSITSDTATVVVGTVIDPELRDEVRVTVIVTGLGRKQSGGHVTGSKLLDSTKSDGSVDYQQLEKPTVMRRHAVTSSAVSAPMKSMVPDMAAEMDYLDIPAFLRRKEEAETS